MLNPDFRDILSEFAAAGVEFLIVGAYALAAHGLPRATGDIDLWVRGEPENAARVVSALTQFGAPLTDITVEDFSTPGMVVQIGVTPAALMYSPKYGVNFDEAWRARLEVEIDGLRVPVLSRHHLLQNKRAAGRPKDLVDARKLEGKRPRRPI